MAQAGWEALGTSKTEQWARLLGQEKSGRKETSRAPVGWKSFGSMGPDNRVSNCLGTSFQGPHVPETSTATSPKSQRGKTAYCLISPLFPVGVFLGSLSHISAGLRKQTPRQPGRQGVEVGCRNRVPVNSTVSLAATALSGQKHVGPGVSIRARPVFVLDNTTDSVQTVAGLKSSILEGRRGTDKEEASSL